MTIARPVRIVTDSGSDLPAGAAQALGISVVPLVVLFGDEAVEEPELTPDAFWERATRSGMRPSTSQPSLGAFYLVFDDLVKRGYDVICITITSKHSGTYSTACAAGRGFGERVSVVDSHALSMGVGHLVLTAAQMAQEGASREEILTRILALRDRGQIMIHLESMESVRHGGRAAMLMPLIDRLARAMSLKAALTMVDGELRLLGVARSTGRSLKRLSLEILRMGPLDDLVVMHVRAPELAHRLVELLVQFLPSREQGIVVGEAGPVLACHGGPGVVGVGAWPSAGPH
ncbi:MAG: DegV family protein [Chloroflexi bacterium]|nr:DegV family protein [Chloroflexota bacterium]